MRASLVSPPAIASPAPPPPLAAARALLIAGDPDDALRISELLADIAAPAVAATWVRDGAAALDALGCDDYDLVLLDRRLGERGEGAVRRAAGDGVPLILLGGDEAVGGRAAGEPARLPRRGLTTALLACAIEGALRQAALGRELRERVKELTVLHEAARLLQRGLPPAALLQMIVELLPTAWQWAEHAAAHATFAGTSCQTANYAPTPWRQVARFATAAGAAGTLEVAYLVARPPADEGPFLAEERALLDSLADLLRAHLEREGAETALRRSEARYRAAAEGSLDAFYALESVRDATGRIGDFVFADLNDRGAALIGMAREAVVGQRLCELLPINRTGGFLDQYARVVETGEPLEAEFPIDSPDIRAGWLHHQVVPLGDGVAITTRDITARKAHEEALRDSERNHRLLMEQAADGIFIADADGRLLDANARGCAMLGYARDELLALTIRDLHPPGEPAVDEAAAATLRAGETLTRERRLRRKDGSLIEVEVSSRLLPDGRLQGIVRDITERKAIEEALRQSAESFDTLFHATTEGILIAVGGRIVAANPTFAALYGCTPEALVGQTVLGLTAPEFRAVARARIAEGYDRPYESAILRPDGTTVPVEVAGRPIRYRGRPARLSSVRDISARKAAEAALRASETRFRTLVQHASDIVTVLGATGTITYQSPSIARVLGHVPQDLVGTNAFALVHPDDLPNVRAIVAAGHVAPGVTPPLAFRMRHRDGSWRQMEAVGNNLLHEPSVRGIVVNSRDITERHEAEVALRESEARLAEAQRLARLGSWEYDIPAARLTWSDETFRIFGHAPGSFAPTGADYWAGTHPEDRAAVRRAYEEAERAGEGYTIEHRVVRPDGGPGVVELRAEIVFDGAGGPRLHRGTVLDITARKALEEQLTHQAFHDALTGLPNRALFADRLAHALARIGARGRAPGSCAVLFLDLDRFKDVNDTLGHDVGDRLLIAVAARLRAALTAEQTLARLGGDEFTVLLEDLPAVGAAVAVAERILAAFERPFVVGDFHLPIATSIGIVVSEAGHERPEDLLRDADIAMYRAKEAGKGRYALFDAGMQRQLLERVALEQDLWRALAREEFVLHYQPIVDLASGRIVAVEALIRWQHPQRGLVPPAVFIPLAEETGIIRPLGRWVLREACRQARAWHDLGHPLTVAVNLTALEFQQPGLVADVAAATGDAGLDPRCLRLEITESVAMRDAEATIAGLGALRALGVRVAIDDFGTGYSSLAYLQRLPVDALKIDRSFVRDLGPDGASLTICRSVTLLAHALGLHVTAEGIETDAQAARLRDLGCDHGQGYHFARPVPAAALTAHLEGGREND